MHFAPTQNAVLRAPTRSECKQRRRSGSSSSRLGLKCSRATSLHRPADRYELRKQALLVFTSRWSLFKQPKEYLAYELRTQAQSLLRCSDGTTPGLARAGRACRCPRASPAEPDLSRALVLARRDTGPSGRGRSVSCGVATCKARAWGL